MEERCTSRQLGVAVFAALLAPASALPGILDRGGSLGWLGPVLGFPLALLVLWRLERLGREGLKTALDRRLRGLSGPVLTLYYIWAVGLSALTAGSCVDRLSRTDYQEVPPWLLAVALAGVCAYLIYKGRGAFFRAAEIFYLLLLAVLAVFLALGAFHLRAENLIPQSGEDLLGPVRGILPAGAALSAGTLAAFFPRRVREPGETPLWRWLGGWCLAAAGLGLLVTGALGAPLAQRAPLPFFLALQGLGFPGGFQRLEALATAAWVLSDLTLLGMAALAGREMAGGSKGGALLPLAGAVLGGCLLPNEAVRGAAPVLMGVNLALGAALPVAVSLLPAREKAGSG